jgi:hypothetical protein
MVVGPLAPPVKASVDSVSTAFQTIFKTITLAIQVGCQGWVSLGTSLVRLGIHTLVDPFAFGTEMSIDAIPFVIQMSFNALAVTVKIGVTASKSGNGGDHQGQYAEGG